PCRTVGGSKSRRGLRSARLAPTASCSRSPIRARGFPRKSCPTCASRSSPPGPRAQASASPSRSATSRKPAAAWTSPVGSVTAPRSEEHTSELQSLAYLVCRLLLEKKKKKKKKIKKKTKNQ